jgi:mannitol/fructose-specific phosphotransferase system IIA component (Ntr-type)
LIHLADYLTPDRVVDLESRSKEQALEELTRTFQGAPEVTDVDALLAALLERERIASTGIGLGVAVPHAKIECVKDFAIAYGRSQHGIEYDSFDGQPVHHVILIAGPPDEQQLYLRFLATITMRLKDATLRAVLAAAPDPAALRAALCG